MYDSIVSFLSNKYSYPFGKEYRRGYKNAWINNIKHYIPWNILHNKTHIISCKREIPAVKSPNFLL